MKEPAFALFFFAAACANATDSGDLALRNARAPLNLTATYTAPLSAGEFAANLEKAVASLPREAAGGIYFQRDDARPWQNCYSIPKREALARVSAGDFKGAGLLQITGVRLEGDRILLSRVGYEGPVETAFSPCAFDEADRSAVLSCAVTVQTAHHDGRAMQLARTKRIEREWRRTDRNTRLIDCRAGTAVSVRNTWEQPFTLADYKVMRRINELVLPLSPLSASGAALKGRGLHRFQSWRAALRFEFMENRMQPEVCDASVEELSEPANLDGWVSGPLKGAWCPWGVEVVSLSCPGLPVINGVSAPSSLPFDPRDPEIPQVCR